VVVTFRAPLITARRYTERDLFDDAIGHRVAVTKGLDARQRHLSAPALAERSNARMRQRHVTTADSSELDVPLV
jgi:hypothetical protein